jgi:hypothetical protein
MVLNILSEWYLAESQRFGILEFFNTIGHLQLVSRLTYERPVAATCYTPPPEPRGRCLPESGCSLGMNFGDVNNWNRPRADFRAARIFAVCTPA